MLLQVDKMNTILENQKFFDDINLKGLKQFLSIPTKIKYECSGVVLNGVEYVTPIVPLYANSIHLQIVAKNGPIHRMMKTLSTSTRHKMYRDQKLGLIGDYVFWNMMMNGFTFIDKANGLSINCDIYYDNNEFYSICYCEEIKKYFKISLKDLMIHIFKYDEERFHNMIISSNLIDDSPININQLVNMAF